MEKKNSIVLKLEHGNNAQVSKEGVKICRINSSISPYSFIKLFAIAGNEINPRVAKENGITQDIRFTLSNFPGSFWLMSKGIVLATTSCKILDRGRVSVSFTEDPKREGIMDGGHNALGIAQFLLQQLFPENKIIKEWPDIKDFWAANENEIIARFNKLGGNESFKFSIPVEIIFPGEEDGAYEEYLESISQISDARNTNVQLRTSTKDNQVGIYDSLKDNLSCSDDVIWKTNEPGKYKVEDIVSLASILLIHLQEKNLLPQNLNTLSPISIYSGKSRCVEFFGDVMRHPDISAKMGDKYELTSPLVKSAMSLTDDLVKFFDKLYVTFPSIYQRNPGKFGGIKAVEMKESGAPFGTNSIRINYRYSPAFFIPLFCGVRELVRYNESTGTVSWIINPASINYEDLDCEKYVEMIKYLDFNPVKIGKAPLMYREGIDTFNAYKNKVLNR